jgi:hypothetical protein
LKGEIEKKNQLVKRQKEFKRMRIEINLKNQKNVFIEE